jgi:hypothetical protein
MEMLKLGLIEFSDSNGQQLAASSVGGDGDDFNSSFGQIETTTNARNNLLQRPLVELNRNTKCSKNINHSVNSASKAAKKFLFIFSVSFVTILWNSFSVKTFCPTFWISSS